MTDEELLSQKLTDEDIKKVRKFCSLSTEEKFNILEKEFRKLRERKSAVKEGKIVNPNGTYTCISDGINWGIPNYADLGLSASTCSWHDSQPADCKIEGKIACLWGCTNPDPVLGWHTKYFASITALENEIFPKGYHKVSDNYGGDYARTLSYGYRYQVHSIGGGYWHSEGPEPDVEFNWYAYLRGWWPVEVSWWHYTC